MVYGGGCSPASRTFFFSALPFPSPLLPRMSEKEGARGGGGEGEGAGGESVPFPMGEDGEEDEEGVGEERRRGGGERRGKAEAGEEGEEGEAEEEGKVEGGGGAEEGGGDGQPPRGGGKARAESDVEPAGRGGEEGRGRGKEEGGEEGREVGGEGRRGWRAPLPTLPASVFVVTTSVARGRGEGRRGGGGGGGREDAWAVHCIRLRHFRNAEEGLEDEGGLAYQMVSQVGGGEGARGRRPFVKVLHQVAEKGREEGHVSPHYASHVLHERPFKRSGESGGGDRRSQGLVVVRPSSVGGGGGRKDRTIRIPFVRIASLAFDEADDIPLVYDRHVPPFFSLFFLLLGVPTRPSKFSPQSFGGGGGDPCLFVLDGEGGKLDAYKP